MLYFASQLSFLANVANVGTIFTVILCLGSMIIFIRQFRLFEYEPSSVIRVQRSVVEESLMKINLPFSLKLGPITSNTTGKTMNSGILEEAIYISDFLIRKNFESFFNQFLSLPIHCI